MTDSVRVRFAARGALPRLWELLLGLAEFERWTEYVTGTQEQLGELLFGPRPAGEALVAERDGRLVGYALFFPVMSSFRTRTMLWLETSTSRKPSAAAAPAGPCSSRSSATRSSAGMPALTGTCSTGTIRRSGSTNASVRAARRPTCSRTRFLKKG